MQNYQWKIFDKQFPLSGSILNFFPIIECKGNINEIRMNIYVEKLDLNTILKHK